MTPAGRQGRGPLERLSFPPERLITALERRTRTARVRGGLSEFLLGSSALSDRWISYAFFQLSAQRWAREQGAPDRLAVLHAGFDAVPSTPTSVVELGCGAGRASFEAAERWPHATVTGYDVSSRMIRAAQPLSHSRLAYACRPAGAVRGPADLVFMCNYLAPPATTRRLLAPGGHVLAISSFQRTENHILDEIWAVSGFREVASADVAAGHFVVLRPD